ncbi:hypothetical protein CLAIMM_09928 [Cladophialophora immunda]|nr:hypothetical protein CLAIMM_09928 [Cladophialophora immunda]
MSSGTSGSDEKISATKIPPLDSAVKANRPHDQSSRGAAGTDRSIDQSRIAPMGGAARDARAGQYQHTAPHADSQGSVGRDETIQGAKIEPLAGKGHADVDAHAGTKEDAGLDDETVDAARIDPLGSVREEQPPA